MPGLVPGSQCVLKISMANTINAHCARASMPRGSVWAKKYMFKIKTILGYYGYYVYCIRILNCLLYS